MDETGSPSIAWLMRDASPARRLLLYHHHILLDKSLCEVTNDRFASITNKATAEVCVEACASHALCHTITSWHDNRRVAHRVGMRQ